MASSATLLGPFATDGMTLTSLLMRQLTGGQRVADVGSASAVTPLGGVFTGLSGAMQAVAPVSGLSVTVNAGYFACPHPTPGHGVYLSGLMAQATLTIASNSSGNPRIDLVCATINDLGTSGSNAVVQVVTGTPASSPSAPALPAASIPLATVAVANGASNIITANITDKRTWTAPPGCVIPVANAAAAPAAPPTQFFWDIAAGTLCQGTGTAGQLATVSFLAAGTMAIVNTSAGTQGTTPGTPTSDPWGIGYGQIGSGGGKGGGGAPSTDGHIASEISVSFDADGVSDYEIAYQWGAAVAADAYGGGTSVTAGQVSFRVFLDGHQVDGVLQFVADSPKQAAGAGTASWFSSAALGTTPGAGPHVATLSVETAGTDTSAASGAFVGDAHAWAGTVFSAPSGWYGALTKEQASLRVIAVQPG